MSVYSAPDWMSEREYIQHLAGNQVVTDDLVDRLKVKLMRHTLDSHMFFMRNYAHALDKYTNEIVLSDPWFGQTCLDYAIEAQRRMGYAQRIVEIKPRQVGWTQKLISRGVWTALHPNHNVLVFIPDTDVGARTMSRVGTIVENLPDWLKPMRKTNNVNLIEFDNPNPKERDIRPGLRSSFAILVPADFRGATGINIVILSEYAKYYKSINVSAFTAALQGGIGESVNTCIVIDTTPMGHDMFYEPMAMQACERNPEWVKAWYHKERRTREDIINGCLGLPDDPTDWIPIFTCWTDHETYTTQDDSPRGELPKMRKQDWDLMLHGEKGRDRIGTVDRYGNDEEIMLQKDYHATIPQLFWRRDKIKKAMQPDWRSRLLWFRGEFATNHESCFISYGKTPFDDRCLDAIRQMIRPPYGKGIMRSNSEGLPYLDTAGGHSSWEEVRLWSTPQGSESYVMGVDVAHAYESEEADFTFCQVLRRRDLKQVMVYKAKVPPWKVTNQLELIYKFYNNPLLSVEMEDGTAYDIVRQLYDRGCTNQYFFKRIDKESTDPGNNPYLGWETNPRTRGPLQETLVKLVSQVDSNGNPAPELIIRDEETYHQLTNMERMPNGNIEGSGKTHDDAVMALMIACFTSGDPWHSFALPTKTEQRQELNSLMSAVMQDYDRNQIEDGIGHRIEETA